MKTLRTRIFSILAILSILVGGIFTSQAYACDDYYYNDYNDSSYYDNSSYYSDDTYNNYYYEDNDYSDDSYYDSYDSYNDDTYYGDSYDSYNDDTYYGDSYIHIDIATQTLYMACNGEIVASGYVVTGQLGTADTPRGVYYVYGMYRELYIYEDYYVQYWMPFFGAYGLHDASWRNEYGEAIYTTDGSHGCVNMSQGLAELVYSNAYVGMTVVVS